MKVKKKPKGKSTAKSTAKSKLSPQPLTREEVLAMEEGEHPSPLMIPSVGGNARLMTASEVKNMYLTWIENAEAAGAV